MGDKMNVIEIIKIPFGAFLFCAYARIAYGLQFRVATPEDLSFSF